MLLLSGGGLRAQPILRGGMDNFVAANIVYPAYAYQNCIQANIKVSFKLNHAGQVYYSKVTEGPGIDLDDEALRLIRLSSGKWKVPAGYDTSAVVIVPVNFHLESEDCNRMTATERAQVIAAYKANTGLTEAVTNFYRHKNEGKFSPAEEKRVLALKEELGYDEAFLQNKIRDGQKKLKQKDFQGACEDFLFVRDLGSSSADALIERYCK